METGTVLKVVITNTNDHLPPSIDEADTLEVLSSCSAEDVYRVICTRPNIKLLLVAGTPYTRQEVNNMPIGSMLGGRKPGRVGDVTTNPDPAVVAWFTEPTQVPAPPFYTEEVNRIPTEPPTQAPDWVQRLTEPVYWTPEITAAQRQVIEQVRGLPAPEWPDVIGAGADPLPAGINLEEVLQAMRTTQAEQLRTATQARYEREYVGRWHTDETYRRYLEQTMRDTQNFITRPIQINNIDGYTAGF